MSTANTKAAGRHDLRATIAAVAALPPDRVVCDGADWSARPDRAPSTPRGRYPTGLHAHGYPELCLTLSGTMRMDMIRRRYIMTAPALALLTPGLEHCEGWHRQGIAYEALWLVLARTGAMVFWIAYRPGEGWLPESRRRVMTPAVTTLYDQLARREEPIGEADFEPLRADLLAILAALHHEQVHEGQHAVTSAAALRPELDHVLHLLDHDWRQPLTVRQLAQLARMTPNYLNRLFRQRTGRSIHRYLTERRMAEALRLCRQRTLSVKQVAASVGYEDPLYFSRAFRRFHGRPPSEA